MSSEHLLTIGDLSAFLQIKKSTIYSMVSRKQIPCIKLSGKLLRFKEAAILEWIENHAIEARNKTSKHSTLPVNSSKTPGHVLDKLIENAKRDVLT